MIGKRLDGACVLQSRSEILPGKVFDPTLLLSVVALAWQALASILQLRM